MPGSKPHPGSPPRSPTQLKSNVKLSLARLESPEGSPTDKTAYINKSSTCVVCFTTLLEPSKSESFSMCGECYKKAETLDLKLARPYKFEPADYICDNIYLGAEGATKNLNWLKENNITRVLTVSCHSDHLMRFKIIEYMKIEVDDDPESDLRPHYPAALKFIFKDMKSNVLVHSVSGVSRAAAIVVAYLMAAKQYSYDKSITVLRSRRPSVNPTVGFQRHLKEWEAALFPQEVDGDDHKEDEKEDEEGVDYEPHKGVWKAFNKWHSRIKLRDEGVCGN